VVVDVLETEEAKGLLEAAQQAGSVTTDEIALALDELDLEAGQIDDIYHALEELHVEVVLARQRLECSLGHEAVLFGPLEELGQFNSQLVSLLSLGSRAGGAGAPPLEAIDTAAGLDGALHTRVGRVAVRAHVDRDLAACRAGREGVAARCAAHARKYTLWMNRQVSSPSFPFGQHVERRCLWVPPPAPRVAAHRG